MEKIKETFKLSPAFTKDVSFQSYDAQTDIADVYHQPLKKHQALEGWFMECFRLSAGQVENTDTPFELKQLSLSKAMPNRINAFHVHPKRRQDELWCVIQGTLEIWLVDLRENSPTKGNKRRFVLSGEAPALLHIPSGVAHGYKSGLEGALLLYAMNDQFDIKDPNEGRLPWDYFGNELWEDDRG